MPPIAPKRDHALTQHGQTRNDEYYWMRNREDPEVKAYLQAENDYLEETLQHLNPLREKLFHEMKARIREVDHSVPEKHGDFLYYTRTEAEKQYPIFCRKKNIPNAAEEILLDQNALAEGHEFCSVSAFSVSPDQNKLAYSVDLEGSEVYTLHIKDLISGTMYPEAIANIHGSVYFQAGVEWANDNETVFYLSLDESHRACKLYRHKVGTAPSQDVLVYFEEDDTFSLSLFKSRSEKYIFTYHYNTISQEMRFLPADHPVGALNVLQPRKAGLEYYAAHLDDHFYIVTNEDAHNFKLMKTPTAAPSRENWQEVIGHREDTLLEHVDVFAEHIVLHERKGGLKQLRVSRPDGYSDARYVNFPDPTYEVIVDVNPEFHTNLLRLRYSSLTTPFSTVDFHMDNGEWEVKKEYQIPGGYDKSQYVTEYIHAIAADGRKIPISLAYKKGLKKDGQNPTLLYGYGAYGASSDAAFNLSLLSLFDRGFVFAIAHVRGGSEMGRFWYDEGRMFNKKNSFTDFIACAEHLIAEGFTSPEKLASTGGSAGGLLVGASMVMRPELFEAVICKVPFVDVITSMSDPSIPLTTLEYDQWGNPANRDEYDYMLSYSPYDNLREVEYPHLLLSTGFNDPRVAYWEPAKFLARLRDKKNDDNLALLQTNFSAGHAGASGRYDYLKENVLDFAFLIDRLGAKP
ncbi:MAG TPA: S9 family peptidase [Anaerolineales bacterium]|nr:S9 family peptidase [Anaerolineales bacterium]